MILPNHAEPNVLVRRGRSDFRFWGNAITAADIAHPQLDEAAGAQPAIDAEIKQGEVPGLRLHLQANPNSPDVPEFQRRLLADQLALVPWLPSMGGTTLYPFSSFSLRTPTR